ncbi:MAG: hypothetical protein NWQ55_13095 [Salibacteraceae bacterium]|jgi:hypothetical protein|nr:hypothetical protein [Salibacteraceae bacterium]MDP4762332.1 hypothetical protein [Salibacteraceae bacterium]MDP4935248.1 hypothetical protein [Salibacteraceae bacterium]MDP4966008.1 hypothetical protein [Salibacteraceae bacterium]
MNVKKILFLAAGIGLTMGVSSCGDGTSNGNDNPETQSQTKTVDPHQTGLVKVGDKLFNLPSPLETAFLLEKVDKQYNEGLLNKDVDATKYATKYSQAMNLGVYGADLGYALIHNQSQSAFQLLGVCKKLGTALGVSSSLYVDLMKRFEGNMENKDSLLIFISELNRLSDEYLKENEAEDVSSLILYGGWVESLHFTTTLAKATGNDKLKTRVGEQKNGLNNLIGLLSQQNSTGALKVYVEQLNDLKNTFDKVGYSYQFVEPETKSSEKLTIIKSTSTVEVSDEVLNEISNKVAGIRKSIIETTSL